MNDLDLAIAVAEKGASVVRRRFGTKLQHFDKGAGDFATNVDIEAENAMLALLHHKRPEDSIIGEESGGSMAGSSERTWLIDPLCGTLNYAARMRVVAVNVALSIAGRLATAAVAEPFNNEIYWTDGTLANMRANNEDTPLVPNAILKLVDLNFDPTFPNAAEFKAVKLAANEDFAATFRPRVVSSSIALTWVATGQRAAYITDGDMRDSVHFSAAIAICEAAGCVVTDLYGYEWGRGATGILAAADQETHDALLEMVRKN